MVLITYGKFVLNHIRKHPTEIALVVSMATTGCLYSCFALGFCYYESMKYYPKEGAPLKLHMVPGEDRLRTHDRMEALRQEIGDFETPEVRKRKTVIPFLF